MDQPGPVNARLRRLPAVDRLIKSAEDGSGLQRWSLLAAARAVLRRARQRILEAPEREETEPLDLETRRMARRLERPFPRRVLNATGVVLHTNLGRAPLAPGAARAVLEVAGSYSDLELDLSTGRRGSRISRVVELLCLLSGAEAACVVNNNAAAVFLALDALAAGREVVLSRGELVEIGGSFRVPEILAASRARLVEVGTTNRTHLEDYARAIGPGTGALLKVHRSNFELRGFVASVSLGELADLAHSHGLPLIEDRGSGTFIDLRPLGLPESEAQAGLAEGADLVLFSGDKLLGGPQAGIVLGRSELVEKMRTSPLARALRVDKMTLAALHWTLRTLLEGKGPERIPVLRMLLTPPEELRRRAEQLAAGLGTRGVGVASVEPSGSLVGGGALPDLELPGFIVRLEPDRQWASATDISHKLRNGEPPVLVRIHQDVVLLDPRTLADDDIPAVVEAFASLRV